MVGIILCFKQLWSRRMMQNIRDCMNVGSGPCHTVIL